MAVPIKSLVDRRTGQRRHAFSRQNFTRRRARLVVARCLRKGLPSERLLSIRNDVGLLAEEYDPGSRRLLGNFPQAFSHVGLVNTAFNLAKREQGPASTRRET